MSMSEYLDIYYSELPFAPSAYIAWARTEAWHNTHTGENKFGNYASFRAAKSRHHRGQNKKQTPAVITTRKAIFLKVLKFVPEDQAAEYQKIWDSCL